MKTSTFFLTALFTLTTTLLFAQPANNNFSNAYNVSSIINSCSGNAAYTTKKATMDKNQASCSNASGYNVWFKFQATAPTMNIKVDRGSNKGNIKRVNLALWHSNGTSQIACKRYVSTDDDVELSVTALTIGNWYYISVDNQGKNNRGTFTLCLNTSLSYDFYEGAINVSSFMNSCSPNAAYTTVGATMDKSQGSCNNGSGYNRWFKFQATTSSISIKIDRGGNKGSIRRVNIALMESDGVTQVGCNRYVSTNDIVTLNSNGLTIGNWYYISVDNNYYYYKGTFTLCLNSTIDYNYYSGAKDVSAYINSCSPNAAYTTVGATMDMNQASCSDASGYNRWFKFQATAPTMNIKVDRGGNKGTIKRANVALWQANGTSQIACNRYVNTDDDVELGATALTIGNWYYISVDNNNSGYKGSFTLCLNTSLSYDFYEGAKDVSSLINSCSPNAAYTTVGATMDKSQGSCNNGSGYNRWFKFQATTPDITVKLDRGSSQGTIYRANMVLMDTDGTTQLACKRYSNGYEDIKMSATNLTVGNWYYIAVDNNHSYYRGTFTLCLSDLPDYNYYQNAIDVSQLINGCSTDAAYSTIDATMDKNQASCSDASGYNVWFKFQATAATMNVKVDRGGSKGTIKRVNVALWQANGTSQIACNRYVNTDDDVELGATALTVGNWYYISVDNHASTYKGTFTLCLNTNLSYDFYEGAIDVTSYIESCTPSAAYTTIGATMDKSQGSCNNGSGFNRWFKFQANATTMSVKVDRGGSKGSIRKVNIAVMESNGITQVSCNRYVGYDDDVSTSSTGLIIGNWYYISVDNNSSGYRGTFTLCLTTTLDYNFKEGAKNVSNLINSCSPNAAFTNVGATMDKNQATCSNASGYNVWFKFQATAPTMNVKVDRGGSKGTIRRVNLALWQANGTSQIACNKYVNTDDDVELGATALTIGNWYYISVDNHSSYYRGTFTLCLNTTLSYDFFEGAIDVSSYIESCSPNAAYSTVGATMDKSQGSCNNGSGYNRWFKFQATATTMSIKVDRGSNKGTIRRVNTAVMESDGITQVGCNKYVGNDDDVVTSTSGLTIGDWYYISVDNNHSSYRGSFTLCLTTTLDYNYQEGAKDVSNLINTCSPNAAFTNIGATMDKSQPTCSNASGYNVWFKFQATATTMNIKVDRGGNKGSIKRVNLGLWQANGTSQIACNRYVNTDDDVELGATALTIGNWYYISVDNNSSSYKGTFTLCLNTTLNYDFFEGAIDLTSIIGTCSSNAAYTTVGATMDKSQGSCNNGSGYNRWFKFQAATNYISVTVDRGGSKGSIKRANLVIMESDGTTQVSCNRYVGNDDDVETSAINLTVGNWYYISVDNNYIYYRGSFTLCMYDVANAYYSRTNGNWNSANTWSRISHTGPAASSVPGMLDVVNIGSDNITVSNNITCAEVNMNSATGSANLSISNALLTVNGDFTLVNNGASQKGTVKLINSGDLFVQNNFILTKTGGNKELKVTASNGSQMEVDNNLIINSSGGGSKDNEIELTGTGILKVNNDFKFIHSNGVKSKLKIKSNATAIIMGNLDFTATSSNKIEIKLENSGTLKLHGSIIRGNSGHGKISCSSASTIFLNNPALSQQIPTTSKNGTTDDITYNNLTVNSSNALSEYTLMNNIHIFGTLKIQKGKIIIPNSKKITVNGNIINNSAIVIESGGSLIQTNTGLNANSGTGTYTIKRSGNGTADSYNIWSSPIQNAGVSTVFSSSNPCDVWAFNNITQAWSYDYSVGYTTTCYGSGVTFSANDVIPGGNGVMNVGKGYFVPGSTTATREYEGQVNNGDINVPITITSLGNQIDWNDDDWNLLGNPYPSALDAAAFWTENAVNHSRIMDALYFWDEGDTNAGYNQYSDYASWNLLGGVNSGNSNKIPNGHIASGQGFWVVAKANTTVRFNNSMRSETNDQFFKAGDTLNNQLAWIGVETPTGYKNNILIGFNTQTTDTVDAQFDAHKLTGNSHVRFASIINGKEFSIQGVKAVIPGSKKVIKLNLFTDDVGSHTFTEYRRENLPAQVKVYLRDLDAGTTTDLSKGSYTVNLAANQEYPNRFELVFDNQFPKSTGDIAIKDGNLIGTPDVGADSIDVISGVANVAPDTKFQLLVSSDGYVLTNDDGFMGDIQVIDLSGKLVWNKIQNDEVYSLDINLNKLSHGIYIIQVIRDNQRMYYQEILKK